MRAEGPECSAVAPVQYALAVLLSSRALANALVLAGLLATAPGRAQDADAERRARGAFEEGTAALARGDIAAGADALRRSLDLYPYLPTAYNLAVALAQLERPAEAAALLDAILGGRYGGLSDAQRSEARALLQDLVPQVARVRVTLRGADAPWLRVDDALRPMEVGAPRVFHLPPGRHVLAAGAENVRAHRLALRLAPGALEEVRIDLSRPPRGTLRVVAPEPSLEVEIVGVAAARGALERTVPVGVYEVGLVEEPEARRSVSVEAGLARTVRLERAARRWPWAVALASVVVVGAAVGLGVGLARRGGGGPENDPVFGTIEALGPR